jgi:hypothetical protein
MRHTKLDTQGTERTGTGKAVVTLGPTNMRPVPWHSSHAPCVWISAEWKSGLTVHQPQHTCLQPYGMVN